MECESWGRVPSQGVALYSGNGLSDSRWGKVAGGEIWICSVSPQHGDRALRSPCFRHQTQNPPGSLGQNILNNSWLQSTRGSPSRQTIPWVPERIPSDSQQAQDPRELTMLGRDSCCTALFQSEASSLGHRRRCSLVHDGLPNKLLLLWCALWKY